MRFSSKKALRSPSLFLLGTLTWRIEVDAERAMQADGKNVPGVSAEDRDLAGVAFGNEQVAVGRGANQARATETGRKEFDLETCGGLRPGVAWSGNDGGIVAGGLGSPRLG